MFSSEKSSEARGYRVELQEQYLEIGTVKQ